MQTEKKRPTLEPETAVTYTHPHISHIAGIDEAGRGALAGPVVAAAVILPLEELDQIDKLFKVNDSKKLSANVRDVQYEIITSVAVAFGVGIVPAAVIDEIGIVPATHRAMIAAVQQLTPTADFLLIDGRMPLTELPHIPQQTIIRGDGISLSIAAASIIAKVSRDRMMIQADPQYPHYRFAQHKGYGTQLHRDAIAAHGPCKIHRHTFAPIRTD